MKSSTRIPGPRPQLARPSWRWTLGTALCFAVTGCADSGPVPNEAAGPAEVPTWSSAPSRWVEVRVPEAASLLEAPAVTRATGATGEVTVTLRAKVERVHVAAGSVVEKGQAIVDIRSSELVEAAARYLGAVRQLWLHRQQAERLDKAHAEGLVRRDEVFAAKAMVARLRADRDRAAGTLRGAGVDPRTAREVVRRGYITLSAPVGGVVIELEAHPGEIIEPGGAPFARIAGRSPARIEVRTATPWPAADGLVFTGVDGRDVPLSAKPVSSVVDPRDGTYLNWFSPLHDQRHLPDGLRGTVRMTASRRVWQVPVGAVAQASTGGFVVLRRDDRLSRVPVAVVASSGAVAFVSGDLEAGQQVAADASAYPTLLGARR